MSGCVGCSCERPAPPRRLDRILLATEVSHSLAALRSAVRDAGATATQPVPGLLEVSTDDPTALLAALGTALTPVEAEEVRALELGDEQGSALLAAALRAPTLARLGARVEHADLLPLFADEHGAFHSVYQPIVQLGGTGEPPVIGYEALLRAVGPSGQIGPASLFASAAKAGWLHVLDRVGRTSALRGASGWLEERLLFVNFLPTTIYRPQVCLRTTEQAAERAGLRLDQLVFEVTESEQITDLDHLEDVFAYYRTRGCRVALDDLGAGYSSLNMLVRLQPDIVKLDKDTVQRLPDRVSSAVVAAVVDITHSYGGLVLAECVETAEQAAAALDLGVDLGQGWLFGRPEARAVPTTAAAGRPGPTARTTATRFAGDDDAVGLGTEEPAAGLAPVAPQPYRGAADVEALLAHAVAVGSGGVTIADATTLDMPLIYVNPAFERTTGYRAAEALGRNCRFLQGPGTDPETLRAMREAIREGRDHVAVLRNQRKDGSTWWNELRLSPVHDDAGRVSHYFGFQSDVTDRVEAEEQVAHLAYHDQLTGLPNRPRLLAALQEMTERCRPTGHGFAVLFIDLDGFKAVNDRLGHSAGDLVLAAAGACLRGALRDGDLLTRYSGDEFVAVLSDVPGESAQRVAQRAADAVLASLAEPLSVQGLDVVVGASVGVALFPQHGDTAPALLQAADAAMYLAKQRGRGRSVLAPGA